MSNERIIWRDGFAPDGSVYRSTQEGRIEHLTAAVANSLTARAALADEMAEELTRRCPACRAGFKREYVEKSNGWFFVHHEMTYGESLLLDSKMLHFNDLRRVYCRAVEHARWLAHYDALTESSETPASAGRKET